MWGPMMELEDSSFNQGVPAQNRCTLGSHDIFALPFSISSRIQLHWSLEQRGQSRLDMCSTKSNDNGWRFPLIVQP
jgi:hypothetical protein